MRKMLAILVAAMGAWAAQADDLATALKYDAVPSHVKLTFEGYFQGDFSETVSGAATGATLSRYSYGKGWKITATADAGYGTPTFRTCAYTSDGDDLSSSVQVHTGTATITGYNVHVYDISVAHPVRILLSLGGGVLPDGESSTMTVSGSTYGTLPTPTRDGFTFVGWFTAVTGGTQVTASTPVTAATSQTLYARWTAQDGQDGGIATTLKYDAVPEHVTLAISGSWQGDFTVPVKGAAAGASLSEYSNSGRGWTIVATPDRGYEVPTFSTCFYDDAGDNLSTAQAHTGEVTRTGYNIHVSDIRVAPKRLTVRFSLAGGALPAGTASSKTVTYDSTYGTLPAPTRTGYTFAGWFTDATDGTQVTAATPVTIVVPQTLYAHWTPVTYTVTFAANGGSGAMPPMTLTYDLRTNLTANAFTRANYTFGRWKAEDGTLIADRGAVLNLASTSGAVVTLAAQWTPVPYTITFDSAGGSAVAAKTQAFGSPVSAPSKPVRAGYTFERWSPALPATMPPRNLTVKAVWKVDAFTVTFDAAGGAEMPACTQLFGTTVKPPVPTRDGYTFAGWTPELAATMPPSNVTVTARWTANTYTVAFEPNGGSGTMEPMTLTYGRVAYLRANAFTRADKTFAGWRTEDGTAYANGAIVSNLTAEADATVTLVAQWGGKAFTITFDSAGGSAVLPVTLATGTAVTAPDDPTRAGYTFERWEPALPATMPSRNLNVKAVWRMNDCTITFDSAGGSSVAAITQLAGTTVTAPDDPTRAGFVFGGWSPALPATMPASNLTVTAQWMDPAKVCSLTFNPNGGEGTMATMTVPVGGAVTVPANAFTKTGCAFAGWNTKLDGTGASPASGKPMTLSESTMLYAQWRSYRVTFNLSEGGFTPESVAALMANGSASEVKQESDRKISACFTEGLPFGALPVATNRDENFSWTLKNWRFKQDDVYQVVTPDMIVPPRAAGTLELVPQWDYEPANALAAALDVNGLAVTTTNADSSGAIWQPVAVWQPVDDGLATGGESVSAAIDPTKYEQGKRYRALLSMTLVGPGTLTFDWRMESAQIASSTDTTLSDWERTVERLMLYKGDFDRITPSANFVCGFAADSTSWLSVTNYDGKAVNPELAPQDLNWKTQTIVIDDVAAGESTNVTWLLEFYAAYDYTRPWPARAWIDNVRWTGAASVAPPPVQTNTVTFNANGGTGSMAAVDVDDADGANLPACAFTRAGNVFVGWNTRANGTGLALADGARLALDADVTLYAQWSTNAYSVTLDPADGSAPQVLSFAVGAPLTVPTPVRDAYVFAAWLPKLPATMPARDLTATAQWAARAYKVSFDLGDGGTGLDAFEQEFGTALVLPTTPTRAGYVFVEWSPELPETMPASNVTFTAVWESAPYSIAFDTAGGTEVPAIAEACGTPLAAPAAPTRTGYTFAGWKPAFPATMPSADLTLTAQWKVNTYTVTFDAAGGSAVAPVTAAYGAAVTAPAAPTRARHTFAGWSPALPAKMPARDLKVTARWTANPFTVSFDLGDGGTGLDAFEQEPGTAVVLPVTAPTRAGYVFAGWSPALPATMPASNVTLVALWTREVHSIVFDTAGGSEVPAISQAYGTPVSVANPVRAGYTFAGWSPALPATMPAEDLTVTARWTTEPAPPDDPDTPESTDPTNVVRRLYATVASAFVESSATYDGYLYDADGTVAGVVQVKRAKYNQRKDVAKVTATVTLAGSKKLAYKGGEWHADSDEVTLVSTRDARVLKVVLGARGLAGTYGSYFIDGALNPFASKDAAVKADGQAVLDAVTSGGGAFALAIPSATGWGGLTVTVKTRGKVSVTGTLADGTRASVSSQLLVGEEACCIPVVSPKFAEPAFAVWLTRRGVPEGVVGLDGAKLAAVRSGLAAGATFAVDAAALAAAVGSPLLTDYLPNGFSVTADGAKWLVEGGAKAGQVKIDRQTGELTTTSANWAALKLSYKAKTGQFSGSFKAYAQVGGRLKATTAKVTGVLVDGAGYGTATVKKRPAAVTVAPENN